MNPVSEIYEGVKSLFVGLGITIGQFFRPTVTVHYPHETLKIPARFRGHIELVRDPSSGKPKCFVCKLCEKACPSDCITVEGVKPEGAKRKMVTQYRLDFTKCSLCGSCVEACRDGAIRFSREYNLASTSKEEFIMDLFKRLEAEGTTVANAVLHKAGEITETSSSPSSLASATSASTALTKPSEPPQPAAVMQESAPAKLEVK